MPALGQGAGKSAAGEKAAKKRYILPSGPRGDAPSTRKADFKKANTYKRTPSYTKAVYKSAPVAARQAKIKSILRKPGSKLTAADKAILDTHNKRAARTTLLMNSKGSDRQQALIAAQKATPSYSEALAAARKTREAHAPKVDYIHETDPAKLKAAGFHEDGFLDKAAMLPIAIPATFAKDTAALGVATYHDPIGVPFKTIKQLPTVAKSVPGGVLEAVQHPAKVISAASDAAAGRDRQSFADHVKQIRKSGGAAEAVNLALTLGGGSVAAGATREVIKAGLKKAGHDVADAYIPAAVRVSGGEVKARRVRKGLIGEAAVRATDKVRGSNVSIGVGKVRYRGLERKRADAAAGKGTVTPLQHAAAEANRKAGRTVELPTRREGWKFANPLHSNVAKLRGRAVHGLHYDSGTRLRADAKKLGKLDKNEQRALYYATTYGIRSPEQAVTHLPALLADIKAYRVEHGIVPAGRLKKHDMVPELEKILADPHAHFTAKLDKVLEDLRPDLEKAGREDPRYSDAIRTLRVTRPQAEILNMERGVAHEMPPLPMVERRRSVGKYDGPDRRVTEIVPGQSLAEAVAHINGRVPAMRYLDETDLDFAKRVAARVEKEGLAKPLYFREDRYGGHDYAAHAVGGSKGGVLPDHANRGSNRQVGLIDTSPAALLQGKARNIKAKHNWALVDKIMDTHRLRQLAPEAGDTSSAIRARAAEAGISDGSYALYNPRIYREQAQQAGGLTDAATLDHADISEAEGGHVAQALEAATVKPGDIKLASGGGWHAVPLETLRELEAETTPSGALGRSADVGKGKLSRAILGSVNVPWLQFQVVNNAAAAALMTGGRAINPKNWVDAARWWNHDLTPEQRGEVGSLIGTDTSGSDSRQVRMGATVNGGFANAYRALKAHPMWHTGLAKGRGPSISELNPLELMFQADRKQTSAFRVLVAYSQHKKAAIRSMGENMGRAEKTWSSISHILQKPPAEMMRDLADNRELLEHNAQSVADYMGDFTTLTAHERKVLNRAVMFYPYVRYSLKLVFWTMPTKHPVMTALLAELGMLHRDELEKLFGGDQLPWNAGKIYFGEDGHVKSIDLARANPALNAIMDAAGSKNPGQLVGVMPPVVGWSLDQAFHRSGFKDREWNTLGKAGAYGARSADYGLETRGRILLNSALSLTYPYREASKILNPGPQGDDSLLWSPRETLYKGTTTTGKLQKKFAARRDAFTKEHDSLIHSLIPLLPQDNRDAENARESAIVKRSERPKGKGHKKAKYFGAGAGGSGLLPSSRKGSGLLP